MSQVKIQRSFLTEGYLGTEKGNPAHCPTFSLKIAMCNHENTTVGRNVSHDLGAD